MRRSELGPKIMKSKQQSDQEAFRAIVLRQGRDD
jgi:hypothetical protein